MLLAHRPITSIHLDAYYDDANRDLDREAEDRRSSSSHSHTQSAVVTTPPDRIEPTHPGTSRTRFEYIGSDGPMDFRARHTLDLTLRDGYAIKATTSQASQAFQAPQIIASTTEKRQPTAQMDDDLDFPPSISQREPLDPNTSQPVDRGVKPGNTVGVITGTYQGVKAGESSRSIRKQRSAERTRFWAEDVERIRDGARDQAKLFAKSESAAQAAQAVNAIGPYESDKLSDDDPLVVERRRVRELRERMRRELKAATSGSLDNGEGPRASYKGKEREVEAQRPAHPAIDHHCEKNPSRSVSTPQPSPPKQPILSIDEIIQRHAQALAKPQLEAKDHARRELGLPLLSPKTPRSVDTPSSSSTSSRAAGKRTMESPAIPTRTTSSPIPKRTSSRLVFSPLIPVDPPNAHRAIHRASFTIDSAYNNEPTGSLAIDHLAPTRKQRECTKTPLTPQTPSHASSPPTTTPSPSPSPAPDPAPDLAIYLRSPLLNRTLHLPRPYPEKPLRLSLAEVGSPTGKPILIFLGLGCVRYLIALFDEIAKAFNLRLICIDRWGYGKTDMVSDEKRGLREWAAIVERVLDEIGVKEFGVMAHSAGAPYALAVAQRMESRVLGRVHLLAPWVNTGADGGESACISLSVWTTHGCASGLDRYLCGLTGQMRGGHTDGRLQMAQMGSKRHDQICHSSRMETAIILDRQTSSAIIQASQL